MTSDFFEKYNIRKLENDITIGDFDCGDDDLNDFIKNEVQFYKAQLIAMPYVVTEIGRKDRILAYFTLANDKIAVTDFESNSQFNKFKKKNFNKEKYLRSYPSVKIGRRLRLFAEKREPVEAHNFHAVMPRLLKEGDVPRLQVAHVERRGRRQRDRDAAQTVFGGPVQSQAEIVRVGDEQICRGGQFHFTSRKKFSPCWRPPRLS